MLHTRHALYALLLLHAVINIPASGQIYRWNTDEVIPGTEEITLGPGLDLTYWNTEGHNLRYAEFPYRVDLHGSLFDHSWMEYAIFNQSNLSNSSFAHCNLTGASFYSGCSLLNTSFDGAIIADTNFHSATNYGFTASQLYSTASYADGNLWGIRLGWCDLSGWNLQNQDLSGGGFNDALFLNTNLSGAIVNGTSFSRVTQTGFTENILHSTGSYQQHDLSGIDLNCNNLTGWDFSGQRLTDASFVEAIVDHASFQNADLRGTWSLELGTALTDNSILPDGFIEGLSLQNDSMAIRDYENGIAITIVDQLILDTESSLNIVFDDDTWGSTIQIGAGTLVDLGGTLTLDFSPDVLAESLVGSTFNIFDWNGRLQLNDAFTQVEWPTWAEWDISDLYYGGTVTLIAAPEPSSLFALLAGCLLFRRKQ